MKTKIVLSFIFLSVFLHGQDFAFKIMLMNKNGNRDSLEFGYSSNATFGIDLEFNESIYSLSSYKNNVCPLIIVNDNKNIGFSKKQIVPPSIGWIERNAIAIAIPIDSMPFTLNWDKLLFNSVNRNYSLITDWTYGGWFDAGTYTFKEYLKDTSEIQIKNVNSNYILNVGSNNFEMYKFYIAFANIDNIILGNKSINQNRSITIYPTFVKDNIYINNRSSYSMDNVTIISLDGRIIKTFEKNIYSIDLSDLINGVYLISVKLTNGEKFKTKIIKL